MAIPDDVPECQQFLVHHHGCAGADHPILFANAAFERATGYAAQEALGKNCRFLQGDDRDQPDRAVIRGALARGEACECLLRNYRKDGRMFWNKLYLFPFREGGETVFFVGVQHDVTLERLLYATLEETLVERAQLIDSLNERSGRMAQLSLDLINAQETERKGVARELHDELGQRLASLSMLHRRAESYVPEGPAHDLWAQAGTELTELVGLVRNMATSLRPPALDYFGLEITVREFLSRQLQNGPAWVFEHAGLPPRLPPVLEISVFRVVQECVMNILRHAQARHVVVEINGGADNEEVELIVRDDGVGFDSAHWSERSARAGRLGLVSMCERVQLLGGSFRIDSAPGAGTRVTATIPLHAAHGARGTSH